MYQWKVPVTRVRVESGGKDQYGDDIPGVESRVDLPRALFAPGGTSEPVSAGATPVISEPTVYWRGEWPDVVATDLLEIGGTTYRVEGKPASWPLGLKVTLKGVSDGGQVHAE